MRGWLIVLIAVLSMCVIPAGAEAQTTTRVSVSTGGMQGNEGGSLFPFISATGRFVAFESTSSNLVLGDTNGLDVFVHDRDTGQTTRVSVSSLGSPGNNSSYSGPLSADGRFVAFRSWASNLVPGDTNGAQDIFVHDRQTGETTRVSVSSSGAQGNGDSWFQVCLSDDGRFVGFMSYASNLVPGDTNGALDIFVHDRQTDQTTRVSVSSSGTQGNGPSWFPSISADGRFVAFNGGASNLVGGDTNGLYDAFVHDRQTGQTTRISIASSGAQSNGDSWNPTSISADGRFVAFNSEASNLVVGDTNGFQDAFVHDRQTGQTTRVGVSSSGAQGNSHSYCTAISADGRSVAFFSEASNLVVGDTNGFEDAFVHDRQAGQTTRVSVSSSGAQTNGSSGTSNSISSDGRSVPFYSVASNLVPGDTNGWDIFVHDREPGQTYMQPNCQPLTITSGVNKIVFITHGCCTDMSDFDAIWGPLAASIEEWIQQEVSDPAQWQVILYNWTQDSSFYSLPNNWAINRAIEHGNCQGTLLARAAVSQSLEHIHFISHSAGSALIGKAAQRVKAARGNATRIHSTFLDAYAGAAMQHASSYGLNTDWSDHYFAVDDATAGLTDLTLPNAHNVDVTRFDPCKEFVAFPLPGYYLSSHGWPHEFYRWTLTGATPQLTCTGMSMPSLSCAGGYGWPLSAERYASGMQSWPFATLTQTYPPGQSPVRLICSAREAPERGAPDELVMATRLDDPIDFALFTAVTSAGGVQIEPGVFVLEAEPGASYGPDGNTAWAYASVVITEPVNFVRYDAQFTSPGQSEGVLSIYQGDERLSGDERFSLPGAGSEEFIFELPEEAAPGTLIIGFRLDAFGTGVSRAEVSNIRTGFGGFLPGTFALLSPEDGAAVPTFRPTLAWMVSPEARTYTVRIAPDPELATIVYEQTGIQGVSVVVPALALRAQTTYHWKVVSTNPLGDETAQPGLRSLTTPPACGDANGDTLVEFADITKVLENWSATYPGSGLGDANRDGSVNFADITKVLENWGLACP
jgi:hypothetical protein